MGLESSLRVMEKTTALDVMEPDEWASLNDVYTTMRRRHDPLCGPAKRFTILPVSLAASLALTRRHRDMLVALGKKPPRKWDAEVAIPPPLSSEHVHARAIHTTAISHCHHFDRHSIHAFVPSRRTNVPSCSRRDVPTSMSRRYSRSPKIATSCSESLSATNSRPSLCRTLISSRTKQRAAATV